jgi:hypothetical protein
MSARSRLKGKKFDLFDGQENRSYRSIKLVVIKIILPSDEITPSSEFNKPLNVNGLIP